MVYDLDTDPYLDLATGVMYNRLDITDPGTLLVRRERDRIMNSQEYHDIEQRLLQEEVIL